MYNIIIIFLKIILIQPISMDNLHNRVIFLSRQIPEKILSKVVRFQNLVANVVKYGKYNLAKFANFLIIVLRAEIVTILSRK